MSTASCETSSTAAVELRPTAQELWQRYHKRADINTENELVEQYLPLVSAIMGRLAMTLPDHVDHDDLRSAGLIGLLQALRNYDPTCGSSFETYARVRIRGAMLDELRRMDWVPRSIHEGARDVARDIAKTEAYVVSRRERKKIEIHFAHLKRILHLGRLRLRGPCGARDEFTLAAIAQNLRKLAKLIPMPQPAMAI